MHVRNHKVTVRRNGEISRKRIRRYDLGLTGFSLIQPFFFPNHSAGERMTWGVGVAFLSACMWSRFGLSRHPWPSSLLSFPLCRAILYYIACIVGHCLFCTIRHYTPFVSSRYRQGTSYIPPIFGKIKFRYLENKACRWSDVEYAYQTLL